MIVKTYKLNTLDLNNTVTATMQQLRLKSRQFEFMNRQKTARRYSMDIISYADIIHKIYHGLLQGTDGCVIVWKSQFLLQVG